MATWIRGASTVRDARVLCVQSHGCVLTFLSRAGITKFENPTLVPLLVHGGAHHYDLRPANPVDTPEVLAARKTVQNEQGMCVQRRSLS
jgi:hypothetical protein